MRAGSRMARSSTALSLMAETRRWRSRPITPADTPESTVSMNRLRPVASSLAALNAACCASRSPVMRLKAADSVLISPGPSSPFTRAVRSPPATLSAASTRRPMGAEMALAADIPSQTAPTSTSRAVSKYPRAKAVWIRARLWLASRKATMDSRPLRIWAISPGCIGRTRYK